MKITASTLLLLMTTTFSHAFIEEKERVRDWQEPYFYRPWGLISLPQEGKHCLYEGIRASGCPDPKDLKCLCTGPFRKVTEACWHAEVPRHAQEDDYEQSIIRWIDKLCDGLTESVPQRNARLKLEAREKRRKERKKRKEEKRLAKLAKEQAKMQAKQQKKNS